MKAYNVTLLLSVIALSAVGFCGCLGDTGGIAPPDNDFVYPVAISTIRDDNNLLVVNSNFDLEYNAGTLVAYRLSSVDTFDGQPLDYDADRGTFILPPGVTLSDYCTGSVTGKYCNLDESRGIAANETIHLGAYASDLNITPNGDRALIPVRGERAIIMVDINDGLNILECGESDDPDKRCSDRFRITSNGKDTLPIEPYHVETMNYEYEEGGVAYSETLGFASHRAGGEVSLFSVTRSPGVGVDRQSGNGLIAVIDGVIEGASGLAANPVKGEVYLVGQRDASPHVAVLDVETNLSRDGSFLNDPSFGQSKTISVTSEIAYGTGARDVAVSPDGRTGFVVTHNARSSSLIKLDLDQYEVSDMRSVCRQSSRLETFVDEGVADDPLDDKLYAFILCFVTGQVYIVDSDYMVPIIRKTGAGPQDITFDAKRKIAYISNFTDSTITMVQAVAPFNVIQVAEANATDDALIVRIGEPKMPKGY